MVEECGEWIVGIEYGKGWVVGLWVGCGGYDGYDCWVVVFDDCWEVDWYCVRCGGWLCFYCGWCGGWCEGVGDGGGWW